MVPLTRCALGRPARSRAAEAPTVRRRARLTARVRWAFPARSTIFARPLRSGAEAGMATAEYAIATLAACGFAGLLLVLLKSDEVRGLLTGIVQRALSIGG